MAAYLEDRSHARARLRILTSLLAAVCLAVAIATAVAAADTEIESRLAAGEVAKALELAQVELGAHEQGDVASHAEQLASKFYEAGSLESIAAAETLFLRALALRDARAEQEPEPLAGLLHDLSGLYFNRGDIAKAEQAERRALTIREGIYPAGDPRTAESRRDLGLIFLSQGRLAEAAPALTAALAVIEANPATEWLDLAVGRNYLAELYRLEGRYADAAAVLEELVRVAPEKLGADSAQFPYFLNNLAGVYRDHERFDDAETLLRRSLTLRQSAAPRDEGAVARATLNLAELYRVQGKLEQAEPFYGDALRGARGALEAGSPELFEFINQLAVLYRDQGRLDHAEPRFREALELVQRGLGEDDPRVAQSQLDLAELLRARKRCGEAQPHYERAVQIREKMLGASHPDVAEALTAQARCLLTRPQTKGAARTNLDRAIAILGSSEAHPGVAIDALALRSELRRAQDPAHAREDLDQALRILESLRPHRGGGEDVRAEYFSRFAPLYERMVRWDVEEGHPDRALRTAERARARVLLDQLAAAHVDDAGARDPALEGRRSEARAAMAEIRERLTFEKQRKDLAGEERVQRIAELERKLDESAHAVRELWDQGRNASPAWRTAIEPGLTTLEDIQSDVIPHGGALLLYEIGSTGSYVFAMPGVHAPVDAIPLTVAAKEAAQLGIAAGPLTEKSLSRVLTEQQGLLVALASPRGLTTRGIGGLSTARDPEVTRLAALFRVVVPPRLWTHIVPARQVLIVPDGALYLLPFESLVVTPGADAVTTSFWLDVGPVVRYAASTTFVHQMNRRDAARVVSTSSPGAHAKALSISDPIYGAALSRLPGTEKESAEVFAALDGVADVVVLKEAGAREPAVRKEIPGKRYVHIATHGLLDEKAGDLFASLALTPPDSKTPAGEDDGFLQLFEIYDLPLDCDLAVLSACSSNVGRVVTGEGVFALSRGFLVAGARRVIASQWAVDDLSTAELVGELFREIAVSEKTGQPVDTALALRDAKRKIRQRPEWASPFYWGPFVLAGVE